MNRIMEFFRKAPVVIPMKEEPEAEFFMGAEKRRKPWSDKPPKSSPSRRRWELKKKRRKMEETSRKVNRRK